MPVMTYCFRLKDNDIYSLKFLLRLLVQIVSYFSVELYTWQWLNFTIPNYSYVYWLLYHLFTSKLLSSCTFWNPGSLRWKLSEFRQRLKLFSCPRTQHNFNNKAALDPWLLVWSPRNLIYINQNSKLSSVKAGLAQFLTSQFLPKNHCCKMFSFESVKSLLSVAI